MKNVSIFSTAFLIFFALFISQTAQAQLNQNAVTRTITTNVEFNNRPTAVFGIGATTGFNAKLDVQGAIGSTVASFRSSSAGKGVSVVSDWPGVYFNAYFNGSGKSMAPGYAGIVNFDPDQGRFDFALTGTASAAANSTLTLTPRMSINKDGIVAIGAGTSNKAKLVVQGAVGSTTAIFGDGAQGISLTQNWPGVGFNAYYSSTGWRAMATGYGMAWNLDPVTGRAALQLHGTTNAGQVPTQTVPFFVNANGSVGIATPKVANGYKLSVGGKVMCEELKVQLKGAWPDYVFADNYKLKSLEEVEAHIQAKNHLPGIPAAAEIEKEGLEVGDMQKKMMEKIEELTLYVIEINKENKALKQRVEQLEGDK